MLSPSFSCAPRILLSPFVLFPLRARCTFTFAFPTYFARLKYERILYPHARPCAQPEAIQASTFHHAAVRPCPASGTSLEPDILPSGSGAGTWLYAHAHTPRRFTCLQQKRAGPAASSFYKKSRISPCFRKGKAATELLIQRTMSFSFKGLNATSTWPHMVSCKYLFSS